MSLKEFLGIRYHDLSHSCRWSYSFLILIKWQSLMLSSGSILRNRTKIFLWIESSHCIGDYRLNTAVVWPCGSVLSHCDVTVNKTLPSEHSCIRWIEEQQQQQNVNHSTVEFLLSCASPPDEECEVVKKWIAQCYFILGVWEVLYLRRLFVKNAQTVMRSRAELQTLQKPM